VDHLSQVRLLGDAEQDEWRIEREGGERIRGIPRVEPSMSAAITVTPVTKWPTVRRNTFESNDIVTFAVSCSR
jgi:hypothetical protein